MAHATATPDRLAALRRLMRASGCTHVLVSDTVDVRYISGFSSSNALVLVSPVDAFLCTDFRYEQAARTLCRRDRRWRLIVIRESDWTFVKEHIPPRSVLGVQSNQLTVDSFDRLARALPRVKLVRLGVKVSEIALVKSTREVATMARAASIGCAALRATLPALRVGVAEREVRDILEDHCRRLGSQGPSFDTIVLFGRRCALPHGVPGATRLGAGDFVLFDFGCTLDGLRSDMTRTFVKGRPSAQQRRIYGIVRQAQDTARRGIRAGVRASTVDRLAREIIDRAGHAAAFGHATGHGVGYRIHEDPRVSARSAARLRAGQVVTVEPGIYIGSLGGVRIEDMVCVTENGARVLTKFPRRLMEV